MFVIRSNHILLLQLLFIGWLYAMILVYMPLSLQNDVAIAFTGNEDLL